MVILSCYLIGVYVNWLDSIYWIDLPQCNRMSFANVFLSVCLHQTYIANNKTDIHCSFFFLFFNYLITIIYSISHRIICSLTKQFELDHDSVLFDSLLFKYVKEQQQKENANYFCNFVSCIWKVHRCSKYFIFMCITIAKSSYLVGSPVFAYNYRFQFFWILKHRNSALVNALAAKGHNVTVASLDKDDKPPKNVSYIYFEGIYNENHRDLQKKLFNIWETMNPLTEPLNYDSYWYNSCKCKFIFFLTF